MEIERKKLEQAMLKIIKHSPKCPICGNNDFGYTDHEAQIMMFERDGTTIHLEKSVSFKPTLVLNCKKCGYLLQFDLIHLLGAQDAL